MSNNTINNDKHNICFQFLKIQKITPQYVCMSKRNLNIRYKPSRHYNVFGYFYENLFYCVLFPMA